MPTSDPAPDDLLLTGVRVHCLAAEAAPASALRIERGRIAEIGAEREVSARTPAGVARFDLGGATVLPGWIDAHAHLAGYARSLRAVDLNGTRSAAEVAARVAAAVRAAPHAGGWVLGRGWESHSWTDPAPPGRALLDAATGARPALLTAHDGHQGWANSAALAAAGIVRETPDPPGGRVARDAGGLPTGHLLENALDLVARCVGRPAAEEERDALRDALRRLAACGLTGLHDLEDGRVFRHLVELEQAGELPLKLDFWFPGERIDELERLGIAAGLGGGGGGGDCGRGRLRVAGVKFFLDGTLGGRTAAMLAPYATDASRSGMLLLEPEQFARDAGRAAAAGLSVAVHCIGDRAVRLALAVLERLPRARVPHRVEHAQCVDPADVERFGRAGIVASMQPAQLFLDLAPIEREWGARAAQCYAFRSLERAGALLAFGSDLPVEEPDPRRGLYAAVARRRPDGTPACGWHLAEALSLREALVAYSAGAAAAAGHGPGRGRLAPGAAADLTVLARDPFAQPIADLLENPVLLTLVDGRPVHSRLPLLAAHVGSRP